MWESTILVMLQVMHLCWFIVRVSIRAWHPCVALAFSETHFAFGRRTHPCVRGTMRTMLRSSKCCKSGITMHGFVLDKKTFE
ncbi:unnamed protein product [Musa textilis]